MAISILNVAKHSLKFSSVQAVSAIVAVLVNIYVATILVPEEYGIYGFLGLWLMYSRLISPGLTTAGYREVPVLLGKGEEKEALRIQNTAITSDMMYLLLPFAVILVASLFYPEPILKFGLIIIAVSYGIDRLVNYWNGVNFLRQNFNVAAKGRFIIGVVAPLVTLAAVNWLRVYALLIAPIGAMIVAGIYFWSRGPIDFRFTFDRKETLRLLKVGVILQAGVLVFWGFRLADRTIIASALPFEQLGFYVYAMGFITMALNLPTMFGNVLQPILWKEAGKADSVFDGFKDTRRIAIYLALGVAVLVPVAQLVFYLIVSLITTKYTGSISVFYVLSYNVYLASAAIIPGLILTSSIVNRQRIFLLFYAIGLALNVIFDILVVRWGYGIVGVAWVTVGTQALVTFILYRVIKGYLFASIRGFPGFMAGILAPFLVTIPFYFLHNYLSLVTSNILAFAGISLAAQAVLWVLVIGIFYRDYVSIGDIKRAINEIRRLPAGSEGGQ